MLMVKTLINISDTLDEIKKNLLTIKKTNCEISVGCSTQIQLAGEMGQKMNGVGLFLTKLMNIKQEEKEAKKGRLEDECN